MRRRGPDATGCFTHERNGRHTLLLHSRLSIIDLDPRANQPFRIGSRLLAFNGELYNYPELRRELSEAGCTFEAESDTEVLARMLIEYGVQGLDRCEGMWALALYDEADGSLLLARDRFGEKPLHLLRTPAGIVFGSEVKLLRVLAGDTLTVHWPQLHRLLVNGYRSLYKTSETFFEGVEELPAASFLRVDPEGREWTGRYWTPRFDPDRTLSRDQAVEGVRERLRESVRLRLRSDVPLAFSVSGGVDSQSLAALARRELDFEVHGFTLSTDDTRYDESALAQVGGRALGIKHTFVRPRHEDFLGNLREMVRQHDGPICTISYYLNWLLMQAIAEHGYRVAVSGAAADELLAGYYDYQLFYLAAVEGTERFASALANWQKHVLPIVRNPHLQDPYTFIRDPDARDHLYLDAAAFRRFLSAEFDEGYQEHRYSKSPLRNRMLNDLFHEVVPVILRGDDLNAMYFSIENRSPFLDRALFEFCNSIPTEHLIREAYGKSILREAMNGIAPADVLWARKKVGFNASIHSLVDFTDPGVRDWLLDSGPIYDHVHRPMIEDLLGEPMLANSRSKFLFNFVVARIFVEEFG